MSNITWAQIKQLSAILYAQYVGPGLMFDGSTGSPSSLALVMDLIHQDIVGYPYEWDFLKVKSQFSLNGGALTYNLQTLFPDFHTLYQIYGINSNQESTPLSDYDANVYPFYDAYTVYNNQITFTGNIPVTGIAYIQYKSNQMVIDGNTGLRKQFFINDTDYSAIPAGFSSVLLYAIGQFCDWLSDSKAQQQRNTVDGKYQKAFNNMLLSNPISSQVHNLL